MTSIRDYTPVSWPTGTTTSAGFGGVPVTWTTSEPLTWTMEASLPVSTGPLHPYSYGIKTPGAKKVLPALTTAEERLDELTQVALLWEMHPSLTLLEAARLYAEGYFGEAVA